MHDKNDATLMQICYKIDASPCYRVFREKGYASMKSKKVLIFCIMGLILWSAFSSKVNAEEDSNYSYLENINYAYILDDSIPIRVEDARPLEEVQHRLTSVPRRGLFIEVENGELNMKEVARQIELCWYVNHNRNHYAISIADATEQMDNPDILLPFLNLFGEDARAIMEHTAEEEDSFISFIRLERVDELEICTFSVCASREEQYHLLIRGEREKAEIPFQHVVIPITTPYANYDYWSRYACYMISQVDVNFDGEADLLIHESFDSGSGGAWNLYRAVVWDKTGKEFLWYSSFPAWEVNLDFDNKRVINRYQSGVSYEVVCEFGVVNGEYMKTRVLILEYHMATNASVLSYFEMGALVKAYDVTDMSLGEIAALYPDLDYWWRG